MKKTLTVLILGFLLVPLYPVYAQNSKENLSRPLPTIKTSDNSKAFFEPKRDSTASAQLKKHLQEQSASIAAQRKAKLGALKDKNKSQAALKISNVLNQINQKRVAQLTDYLTKMSDILSKFEVRITQASASGKDTSAATEAVNTAKDSIASAQAAVDAQKLKDYTINATDEAHLRQAGQATQQSLRTDLQALEKQVKDAKQSVMAVASISAKLLGGTK